MSSVCEFKTGGGVTPLITMTYVSRFATVVRATRQKMFNLLLRGGAI
jgi:hypothetical protein